MTIKTIGSDPEFPCHDGTKFISMCGILGGSKEFPQPIEVEGCYKQEDNVGAELNIPPCTTTEEMFNYIDSCIKCVNEYLHTFNDNWNLCFKSSGRYEEDELCHPSANIFGCEPSFSIYRNRVKKPSLQEIGNLRSFG